ncbi:DUF4349 domain-containing protein [Microbacterium sp. JC 701]|uniref:DUF4349 domain-containing protein n=1 Tax=Microbacterium sp. JC 701 TaxID=2897389 RepID=UPI001E45D878|nr:DUF4349 domain-containing protein [Microbacterium sp. JC 701]MCD2170124.1 DUF4349 domain-containing protein [Microbacterium sp. JC 701]
MTTPTLPPLSHDRVEAIEAAVFGRIADERDRRRRRRRGVWTGVAAAAAVVVVAAIVGPSLGVTQGTGASSTAIEAGSAPESGSRDQSAGGSVADTAPVAPGPDAGTSGSAGASSTEQGSAASGTATAGRDIVATGSSTVEVDDVAAAIAAISATATGVGGYVESSQVGGGQVLVPIDGAASTTPTTDSGWITVRVPADTLTQVMEGLGSVGDVTATSVTRSDVTEQSVDLRARVAAGEASVARLTELLAQAASVSDLVTAESALADRQAQLDSDRQVLQSIESQVALSSLSVQLNARTATVTADPAGFGDGLVAGWNGLVATLNGLVIGLGFLLPWIVVAGAAWAIVWGVRRAIRRRRAAREG